MSDAQEEYMEILNTPIKEGVIFKNLEHLIESLLNYTQCQEGGEMLAECSSLNKFDLYRFLHEFRENRISLYDYESDIQKRKTDCASFNNMMELLPFMNGK